MTGVFLIHSMNPGIGGMESHQRAFICQYYVPVGTPWIIAEHCVDGYVNVYEHLSKFDKFKNHKRFNNVSFFLTWLLQEKQGNYLFFLNDAWWIESVPYIRESLPLCRIIMRSGGNDVEKASCRNMSTPYHIRREFYRDAILQLDGIIANSNFSINRLINLGIPYDKIIKIRGGVNQHRINEIMTNQYSSTVSLKAAFLGEYQYLILFVCRFVRFKGVLEALKALVASTICHSSKVLLIGEGPELNSIMSFCRDNLRRNQFSCIGPLDNNQVLIYIAAADIVVNTSIELLRESGDGYYIHTETMGRTMMEAICSGTHILATDVGGTRELFDENEHIGILVGNKEEEIIKGFNSIKNVILTPVALNTDYSWKAVYKRYDMLFENIMENQS